MSSVDRYKACSGRRWTVPGLLLLLVGCAEQPSSRSPQAAVDQPEREASERVQAALTWPDALVQQVREIDRAMPGEFGVHVRHLGDGGRIDHGEGPWYLSSTIKVPVAMAVLEQVQSGQLALDQELVLQRSDFVDGAGDLIWQEPGGRYRIATLIEKSVRDSDSTATDMLIRLLGESHLNRRVRAWVGRGFGPITTILQVRYDAYGELHPGVAELSNMDLVALRNAEAGEPRLQALLDTLGVSRDELAHDSIEEAFERYYQHGNNGAELERFGDLLEELVTGAVLDRERTMVLLDHMHSISTGDRRIAAGLPHGTRFAQKTGTQLGQACNVGVIDLDEAPERGVIVVACARGFERIEQAEEAFQALGRALTERVLDAEAQPAS